MEVSRIQPIVAIPPRVLKRRSDRTAVSSSSAGTFRPPVPAAILLFSMPNSSREPTAKPRDHRRTILLVLAVGLLVGSAVPTRFSTDSSAEFASHAMLRIGLVLGALWLAWDSLRKPARWLPPGIAVMGVVGLIVVATHPRMVLFVIPAFGVLLSMAAIVRAFKK